MDFKQKSSKGFAPNSLNFDSELSPPISNRGGLPENEVCVGVDWLAFTMSGDLFSDCWETVSRYYPLELSAKSPVPCRGYREVVEFQDGPKVSYSDDRPEIHIQFSGRIIGSLPLGEQVSIICDFLHLGAKCTRIDLRLDDCRRLVTPAHMVEWSKQGYLCKFRRWKPEESFSGTESLGLTFYAGRRGENGSGCFFRCYEWHLNEHGDKVNGRNFETKLTNSVRYECEFTQHKSTAVCSILAGVFGLENIFEKIREIILGSVDFRSGDSSRQSYRDRERVSLWANYANGIFPYKFSKPTRPKPSGFPISAFAKQWGGKLAEFLQVGGFSAFSKALLYSIQDGVRRGRGCALPAEKLVVLKTRCLRMFPNLEHTRRYLALLPT